MAMRGAGARFGLAVGASAVLLALAGCGKEPAQQDAEQLDNALVGSANDADPALTSALEDQIMVDPALTQQANGTSARPTATPLQAPVPPDLDAGRPAPAVEKGLLRAPEPTPASVTANPTLGELAKMQAAQAGAKKNCLKDVKFSLAWAQRLAGDIPLYPQAQVSEAAGNDDNGCRVRIVSFTTTATLQPVLDWYYTQAKRGGYSAEHELSGSDHILAGTKGESVFYLMARNRAAGGTDVDLVVNRPI